VDLLDASVLHIHCERRTERAYLLIIVDLLEVVIKRICETRSDKLLASIIGQPLLIELALEILESESIVQDINIPSGWCSIVGTLDERRYSTGRACSDKCREQRATHLEEFLEIVFAFETIEIR